MGTRRRGQRTTPTETPTCRGTTARGLPCRKPTNNANGLCGFCKGPQPPTVASHAAAAAKATLKSSGSTAYVATASATYNNTAISFEHSDGQWRRVDAGTYATTAEAYTAQMEAVLVGEAAARTLNEGLVQPEDVGLLVEFIAAMASRASSGRDVDTAEARAVDFGVDVPEGTLPVAWQAVALHTVYHIRRDADAAWEAWDGEELPYRPSMELVEDRFFDNDPLPAHASEPDPDAWPPVESSIERAVYRVCAAEHAVMPHLPLELLPVEAGVTFSPQRVAERSGFGARVGGDLSAAARLHEALPGDGWYMALSGLIIMSQAHRTAPGTPEFEEWLRNGLLSTPENAEPAAVHGERNMAISGLMDVCLYDKDDSTLALDILEHIARIDPQTFRFGVVALLSQLADDENEDDIYRALAARPQLEALARRATAGLSTVS